MTNETLKQVVGDNVRRLRSAAGMTQAQLAELAGRDASSIAHIEQANQLPGVELLLRLAEIFAVSTDTLLCPQGSAAHFLSIVSMLGGQSDEALAHLEAIVRAWLFEYGDPKPPMRKPRKLKKEC